MKSNIKIYTKTGDKGETSLLGGTRVPKYHQRIEAYGTLDELNSFIGLVRDLMKDSHTREVLLQIQNNLFIAESLLAAENISASEKLPQINPDDIAILEKEIDRMNIHLPELHSFIIPGGHPSVSYCHIARCICRRAERVTIELGTRFDIDNTVIQYLNRLSDYLFVLARQTALDNNAEEILWRVRK